MTERTFTARLILLLGFDIALTLIDAYIPHEWTQVRAGVALIEFSFMAVTMAVAMRQVLKDY